MRLIASAALLLLITIQVALAGQPILIATGEWPPWTGRELHRGGFVNHVVELAFAERGHDVVFEYYPWKRAYFLAESGQTDAASYVYESDDRRQRVYYSDPITEEKLVFFVKKGADIEYEKLEDLTGYKIGITRGNTYTDEFRDLVDQQILTAEVANTDLINFKKLLFERIDIMPASALQGTKVLRSNFDEDTRRQIVMLEKPLNTTTGHLMFTRSNPRSAELLEEFNLGLEAVRSSGRYDTLFEDMLNGAYDTEAD